MLSPTTSPAHAWRFPPRSLRPSADARTIRSSSNRVTNCSDCPQAADSKPNFTGDRIACYGLWIEGPAAPGRSLAPAFMLLPAVIAIRQHAALQSAFSESRPTVCNAPYAEVVSTSALEVRPNRLRAALMPRSLPVENRIVPHCFSRAPGRQKCFSSRLPVPAPAPTAAHLRRGARNRSFLSRNHSQKRPIKPSDLRPRGFRARASIPDRRLGRSAPAASCGRSLPVLECRHRPYVRVVDRGNPTYGRNVCSGSNLVDALPLLPFSRFEGTGHFTR
jgi:hypothetical protein